MSEQMASRIERAETSGVLDLSGLGLVEVPRAVLALEHLRELDLSDNRLSILPPEIANLRHLTTLDVRNNQISRLPVEVADLAAHATLHMDGNPLDGALAGAQSRGADALATYLRSLTDGQSLYEAKVLLVGEGSVGKSSLAAALAWGPFDPGRPTTHGIEITALDLPHPTTGTDITVRTWDFGGQEIYRITHQFFFTSGALYLLCWNPREGLDANEIDDWLRRIRAAVGPQTPVLIVATHADARRPELDIPGLRRRYGPMLHGFAEIDSQSGRGLTQLRDTIAAEVARLPQTGAVLSARWLAARDAVLDLARDRPFITFDEFGTVCGRHGVRVDEVEHLGRLMHDLGQVLYFSDYGLNDIVVLNPEWVTRAVSHVLEDQPTRLDDGLLDHTRLRKIWSDRGHDEPSYPRAVHPYLLRLMEKFELCYRLSDGQHSLLPQLLPYDRPALPWEPGDVPDAGHRSVRLLVDLTDPAPSGLVAFLIVRHHRDSTGRAWRNGVFLRHPVEAYDSEAIIQLTSPSRLELEVRAPSPDFYFAVMKDSVEVLLRQRWPGLGYSFVVPCPSRDDTGAPCTGTFPLSGLVRLRERGGTTMTCLACMSDHDATSLLTGYAPRPELAARPVPVAADSALALRLLFTAAEPAHSPRLVTLVALRPSLAGAFRGLSQFRLTLWCEHLDETHPVATYKLNLTEQAGQELSGYLRRTVVAQRLLVPADAAISHRELEDTTRTVRALATPNPETSPEPTLAEATGLRRLRMILRTVDPAQGFGGLRHVVTPAGEAIWVCPHHARLHDPGLPVLPD